MPERVKRFNIGKVTNSRQKDLNGDSTKEEKSKSSDLSNKNEIDQLSNPNITDNNYSHIHLDNINLKIIEELLNNGDIKSSEIATKLAIPLSTIQRRRTKIEKTIVRKTYEMSLNQMGFRTALIFADVQKGKAKETGEKLLKRYDHYILRASTRINSSNNLCLEIIYDNSEELHALLEEIKAMPLTTSVDWSEQVYPIGDNISSVVNFALTRKIKELETSKNN